MTYRTSFLPSSFIAYICYVSCFYYCRVVLLIVYCVGELELWLSDHGKPDGGGLHGYYGCLEYS